MYGGEAWTLYRRHIKALEARGLSHAQRRSLQSILGVRWWHRVSHTELLKRSVTTPVEHLLQRQLRWLGHVFMPENRLPRRLLYGELSYGQRSVGRPKKRLIDHIKINLRKCLIKPCDLETLASDRVVWKATCEAGLAHFVSDWLAASEERRAAYHTAATKPKTGPQCPHCGRTCACQFGLQSHLRIHIDPSTVQLISSATSSLTSMDFSNSSSSRNETIKCIIIRKDGGIMSVKNHADWMPWPQSTSKLCN